MTRPFLLLAFLTCMAAAPVMASDRVAMVIGMGDYEVLPDLVNPSRDAEGVATALREIGFEVELFVDAPLEAVEEGLEAFSFRAETADLALIYFAGHGIQVQGENYLLPVDAQITSNAEAQAQSLSLSQFLASVDRARRMRIVILDACRDAPFGQTIGSVALEAAQAPSTAGETNGTRSAGGGGLAAPSPDRGTLVAFAAKDGHVALDGAGDNSPFATALMDKLPRAGLEISLMFRQVRDQVMYETGNQQEPYVYGSLPGIPYFLAGPAAGQDALPADDVINAWSSLRTSDEEALLALADAGDTRSMVGLAYKRMNPASDFRPEEAYALFKRAADAGSAVAQFELAKLYEQGIGVPQNNEQARSYFRRSAESGFPDALNDMGFMHFQGGLGFPIDRQVALSYFRRAADARHPEAQYNFAALIDDGVVPDLGPEDAARYLYAALRSGSERVLAILEERPTMFTTETRRAVQEQLRQREFYIGPLDGDFGPSTRRGLRAAYGVSPG
ncbi:MAG: caspase family protein [Pseudomonadota bacterium]